MVAFAFIIDIGEFGFLYNDSPLQMDMLKKSYLLEETYNIIYIFNNIFYIHRCVSNILVRLH